MAPLCLSIGAGITSTNVLCVFRVEYGDSHGRNMYESIINSKVAEISYFLKIFRFSNHME